MVPYRYTALMDDLISVAAEETNVTIEWNSGQFSFACIHKLDNVYNETSVVFVGEFPANCAWILVHSFRDTDFDYWISFVKKVAKEGDYAGVIFSLNTYQRALFGTNGKFTDPDIRLLLEQYNQHSWNNVYLYIIKTGE